MGMSVKGKIVAITGASGGIGSATAKLLAMQGATVVLAARNEKVLEAIAEEINALGGTALFKATDVRRRKDLEALVAFAVEHGAGLT